MRRTNNKSESLKLLVCGLVLGCVLVTLLASRSLFGTGAAVVQQIHQPRRGLQVAPNAVNPTLRLFRPAFSAFGASQALKSADPPALPLTSWSSVQSLHHSRAERGDTSPKGKGMYGNSFYHVFENVKMDWAGENEFGVYFYHPANEAIPEERRIQPKEYHKSDYGPLVRIGTHYEAVKEGEPSPLTTCKQWVNEPAILFHATYPDNIFHFMNDAYLAVLQTLIDSDLAPQHVTRIIDGASSQCDLPPTLAPAEVVLVALNQPDAYHQTWSHLLQHITPAQATARQLHGHCFRKLVLGTSKLLDAFWNETGFQPETLPLRRPALQAAQRFLMASALTHKLEHLPPGEDRVRVAAEGCARITETRAAQLPDGGNATTGWRSSKQLPQVVLASRTGPHETRALLNEADVVRFVEAHWEVELKVTDFSGWLFDTVDLMQHTDFFLGMHGAGMTNVYFLPENASMMQLLPYGWNLTKSGGKHKVIRGGLYNQMGRIQGIRNHYWINSNPKHAFFQKKWFDAVNKSDQYRLHPGSNLELPMSDNPFQGWIYQDTLMDLKTLEPVLAAAFAEAGIHRRTPALPFKETFVLPAEPPESEKTREKQPEDKKQAHEKKQSRKKAETKGKAKAVPNKAVPEPEPEVLWTGIVCTGELC